MREQPTIEITVIGHDNRQYSLAEVEQARERAARGDKEALALIASINAATPDKLDMMQILHDCPECRAAMARGEKPVFLTPADLGLETIARKRKKPFPRRPRWR